MHSTMKKVIRIPVREIMAQCCGCREAEYAISGATTNEELQESVLRLLRIGVQHLRDRMNTCSFEEAAWQSVSARTHRRTATLRDLRYFVRRILRDREFGAEPLRAITPQQCRRLLQHSFGGSLHSYKKARAIMHSIFAYGIRQEWCDTNPVDKIEVPYIKESPITPLSISVVRRLESTATQPKFRDMLLSLRLMLYCGLRPAEVARLNPQRDIDWCNRHVYVRAQTSKTGGGRMVPLRCAAPIRKDARIIPSQWEKRWRELRRAAGIRHWQADACRHSFASYHAAYFRNLPQLQLEMGHRDCSLLYSRYIMPLLRRDATQYWRGQRAGIRRAPAETGIP